MLSSLALAAGAFAQPQNPVERSWTILKEGVRDAKVSKRAAAVRALGLLEKNETARMLAESTLADPDAEVRAAAATALGEIDLDASIPKLKEALKDQDTAVVFSAAGALFMLHDPAAYSVYYAVLSGERKTGEPLLDSQLKMLKDPKALANIGFEQGMGMIPFGGIGYKAFKSFTRDDVSPVRAAAAQKLAHDPDPKSIKALANAASDEKWIVRASAVSAIAQRGDSELLSAVIPRLDDQEDGVRYNAAAAVVSLYSLADQP